MNLLLSRLKLLLFAKATFVFNLLGIVFLVLTYKPYCSDNANGSSLFKKVCVPCPENSVCSFRKVIACSSGYSFRSENEICIKDIKQSIESHQLSLRAQRFIEEQAFRYECIGDKNATSLISEDELFEYTISESTGSETYLNKLFDETLAVMMKNSKIYQIATDGSQNYYSFKFQSLGACLFDTYQFSREADPSHKKKATIVSRTRAATPSTSNDDVVPSEKFQSLEKEKKELNNQLKQTKSDMNKLEREKVLLDNQLKQDKSEKEKLAKEKAALEAELNKVVKSSGEESSKKADELRSELERKKQEHDALLEEERTKATKKQQALENEIKQLKELKAKLEAEVKSMNTKKESDDYF